MNQTVEPSLVSAFCYSEYRTAQRLCDILKREQSRRMGKALGVGGREYADSADSRPSFVHLPWGLPPASMTGTMTSEK